MAPMLSTTSTFPYDIRLARARLLERRAAWTQALANQNTDHVGRRPLDGLPQPELEPPPDSEHRCPLYLARQYTAVLEATPPFIEAFDPLPSAYAHTLWEYIPAATFAERRAEINLDRLWGARDSGVFIGMPGHWVPDLAIGLTYGWGGLRRRIQRAREKHSGEQARYLDAQDAVVQAAQAFIRKHARHARALGQSATGMDGQALRLLADNIETIVEAPPRTFRQALVWLAFYMTLNRTYNGSNVIGRLDVLLDRFCESDVAAGRLNDEQAVFLLQALLIHDTHFICLGGTDAQGRDASNRVSRLVLEAWRGIRGPANIGLRVHAGTPPDLLELAVACLLETGEGTPTLINDDAIVPGLAANGMPEDTARTYAYGGCHWWGVPGRQYGLSDGTKLNLVAALNAAFERMVRSGQCSVDRLWQLFEEAVGHAFQHASQCYAIHLDEAGKAFPELFGSFFAHDTLETGRDVFDGALEYNYFVADAMGLANVADAFAALETVVEQGGLCTWEEVRAATEADFVGHATLQAALEDAPKFGNDDAYVDAMAQRVRDLCVAAARNAEPADGRFRILPGFYSYLSHVGAGGMKATPDGRRAGTPLAQGANPAVGRARKGHTAIARSVAGVQTGRGVSAPLHLEVMPDLYAGADGRTLFTAFAKTFFRLGGTQLTANFTARESLADALEHPERHGDLVIRVTGFSAYFVKLQPDVQHEILGRYAP